MKKLHALQKARDREVLGHLEKSFLVREQPVPLNLQEEGVWNIDSKGEPP